MPRLQKAAGSPPYLFMDRKIFILAAVVLALAVFVVYNLYSIVTVKQTVVQNNLPDSVKNIVASQPTPDASQAQAPAPSPFSAPLDRAGERITKKPFGLFVTPQNSPVQPEKFRGYHTGTDFETFPEEASADVPVRAICDGKLLVARTASGYGGVAVESCKLNDQPITVIYGHLKLASITKKSGDSLAQGENIGVLGKGYSAQTDGERKHLHLGIHRGGGVSLLGYVQKQSDLSQWIDACSVKPICE